jgi:nucleotide-binding universal stress UspA family protein
MTVLVSYIPTPEGWAAYEVGVRAAKGRDTAIVVLNVAVGSNYSDVTFADEKDLDGVRTGLAATGLTYDVVQILDADNVAETVLRVAAERQVELIVVGLRRHSAVRMALLGSNAQHIILAAPCPVLSVRPS